MTKFVFVTGGVVSSLGKGIAAASLGAILESRGLKVTLLKLDPYINVDPGTMSPFQHGEVFVTDDGAETDLDLGHYERFISRQDAQGEQLHHRPDLRIGDPQRAARRISGQDGAGDSAHHRRNQATHPRAAPKASTWRSSKSAAPSATSNRCLSSKPSARSACDGATTTRCFVHLTLVPYHRGRRRTENQADPAQRAKNCAKSVSQPDVLLCRADREIPDDERREDFAVLERAGKRRDFGVGCGHHLQDSANAARPGLGRDRLRKAGASPPSRPTCQHVDQAGRCTGKPEARGHHRHGRQIRRSDRVLQVADRSLAPRRHPYREPGQYRIHRFRRNRSAMAPQRWRNRCDPGAGRLRQARHRRQDHGGRALPAKTRFLTSASASACKWR